jgi:hypothetical protein
LCPAKILPALKHNSVAANLLQLDLPVVIKAKNSRQTNAITPAGQIAIFCPSFFAIPSSVHEERMP